MKRSGGTSAMGIAARAAQLAASRPQGADAVATALERLTTPGSAERPGMGDHFKTLAIMDPGLPPPPGFAPDPVSEDVDLQIEPASTMKLLAVHMAASSEARNRTIRAR